MHAVALPVEHVQHGRHPAAILGRISAFYQFHAFHGIGVEGAEDAAKVVGIVHVDVIQQDQVLIGRTAPDIESGRKIGDRGHAGQGEDRAEDIGFHRRNHALDVFTAPVDSAGADLRTFIGGFRRGAHHHLAKLHRTLIQADIDHGVRGMIAYLKFHAFRQARNLAELQGVSPGLFERDHIVAFSVCLTAYARSGYNYINVLHRFGAVGPGHKTADSGRKGTGAKQQAK